MVCVVFFFFCTVAFDEGYFSILTVFHFVVRCCCCLQINFSLGYVGTSYVQTYSKARKDSRRDSLLGVTTNDSCMTSIV